MSDHKTCSQCDNDLGYYGGYSPGQTIEMRDAVLLFCNERCLHEWYGMTKTLLSAKKHKGKKVGENENQ